MKEIFNQDVVSKIVAIEFNIYDAFADVLEAKYNNVSDFEDRFKYLKVLIRKEKYLISKMPENINFYKAVSLMIKDRINQYGDDDRVRIVKKRLLNYIDDCISLKSDEQLEALYDGIIVPSEKEGTRISIRKNIDLKFVDYINYLEFMNLTLPQITDDLGVYENALNMTIFENVFVFDAYMENKLDFSKVLSLKDEELSLELGLTMDELAKLTSDNYNDYISTLLNSIFVGINSSVSDVYPDYYEDLVKFSFLLRGVDTKILIRLCDKFSELVSHINDELNLSDLILDIVKEELANRDDYKPALEPNEEAPAISLEVIDAISNLVKVEEELYYVFIEFFALKSSSSFERLSQLVSLEKNYLSKIVVTPKILDRVREMVTENIDFFMLKEENSKKALISTRLLNMLPFFRDVLVPATMSSESFHTIFQNHMISTLNDYRNSLNEIDDSSLKEKACEIFVENFYTTEGLIDDLVAVGGNFDAISSFSDEICSQMVFNSFEEEDYDEYLYDKSIVLAKEAKETIDFMLSLRDFWKYDDYVRSLLQFNLTKLSDIMDNVDESKLNYFIYITLANDSYDDNSYTKQMIVDMINSKRRKQKSLK